MCFPRRLVFRVLVPFLGRVDGPWVPCLHLGPSHRLLASCFERLNRWHRPVLVCLHLGPSLGMRPAPHTRHSRFPTVGAPERGAVNSHAGEARATKVGPARIDTSHRRIPEVGTPRDGTLQVGAVEVAPAEVALERPALQVASLERLVGLQRAGVEQLGLGRRDGCVLAAEDRLSPSAVTRCTATSAASS